MYIVTGGLGFIGSNIVKALHDRREKVLIVDDRTKVQNRIQNINDSAASIVDIVDIEEFYSAPEHFCAKASGVFHQGACADTTERDSRLMLRTNFDLTRKLLGACVNRGKKIVYASSAAVYGNSTNFSEDHMNEKPLNVYGLSKLMVDNHVRAMMCDTSRRITNTLVGLRYFNVYGPREGHKGKMMSMPRQLVDEVSRNACPRIFKDGSQSRDFVSVHDVVSVNMHFMFTGKRHKGIFNVGSGVPVTFMDLAKKIVGDKDLNVHFIDMPENVASFYQSKTCADLTRLREAGYDCEFLSIDNGLRLLNLSLRSGK